MIRNFVTKVFLVILVFLFLIPNTYSSNSSWKNTPLDNLNNMNSDSQNSALDEVDCSWIEWVLDSIRNNVQPYIDWMVYIWLSVAFLLIIYNWISLIFWFVKEDMVWKVKTRIYYLSLWVIILISFLAILKLIMSLLQSVVW